MRRRPVRQWVVFLVLALGLAACAVGASRGEPNSWGWFALGAGVAIVIAALVAIRRQSLRR